MKTDRFDEEFRRKLRELPEESSPDEVNRIAGYVGQHLPPAPGTGWGGLAGYVAGGLVLFGSLLYNVVQYQKTMVLKTTVDSLKTTPPALAQQPAPVAPLAVRTDTIYVTRYQNPPDDAPIVLNQPTARNGEQPTKTMPGPAFNRPRNPVLTNPNQPVGQTDGLESGNATNQGLSRSSLRTNSRTSLKPAQNEAIATTEPSSHDQEDSTGATAVKLSGKNAESVRSELVRPEINADPTTVRPLGNRDLVSKNALNHRDASRANTRQKTKAINSVNDVSARERMGNTTGVNQTLTNNTTPNPTVSGLTKSGQPRTDAAEERTERAEVAVSSLKSKALTSTNLSAIILRKPVYQPIAVSKAMSVRKPFRLHLPTVSLPNPQYFGGVGFLGGDEHLGGSLLGEVRLNRHWSVQTGIRVMALTGFDYHSDEDYKKEEGRDFRALYAPNVAPGNEIQDIQQNYSLIQIPLTVAYHYPLGRAWGLRLALGTGFDVLAHSRITFDFERSGREFEHGLHESNVPVSLFNNATVSAGVERQWKRLLFRASPYISPQLRRVSYKDDAFYWGGQVQVLWQFK